MIVDAKHQAAQAFYVKYGFAELEPEGWPQRMFLPMATVATAFGG